MNLEFFRGIKKRLQYEINQLFATAVTVVIRQSLTALPGEKGECFLLFLFHSPGIRLCVPCILEAFSPAAIV